MSTEPAAACFADYLRAATGCLAGALQLEVREARLEAAILMAHALGVNRTWLVAHDRDIPTPEQAEAVFAVIGRREQGEPVAYIIGKREFYGRMFIVTPDVLIPRPDTELLLEAALERLPQHTPSRALDLGAGSGCIAISLALARPGCAVVAVERSAAALAVARSNAARHQARVDWHEGDWFTALPLDTPQFDVIVSNPPYIAADDPHLAQGDLRFEPGMALAAGHDGLDDLRRLIATARTHLADGGGLLLEHGWNQGEACRDLLDAHGYTDITTLRDLSGHERVTSARHQITG